MVPNIPLRYLSNALSGAAKMVAELVESNKVSGGNGHRTKLLKVAQDLQGQFEDFGSLEKWQLPSDKHSLVPLIQAAQMLGVSNTPVAFPTETVYGLGADATRSEAVKGIYRVKGRPSDNPLIIHVCDLSMLRDLLTPPDAIDESLPSVIPSVYIPLIQRFWPGPLTILLSNPIPSRLAPEVTSSLPSFGVRMPNSPLALSLIKLAGVPIAAPSANASTRPSCTTAQHVLEDLDGRIELIIDGGPCQVGMESTVVDGLSSPPCVLRPGGISMSQLRSCPGWENVVKAYEDISQDAKDQSAPRAPGMKYKHYSPRAKVMLFESVQSAEKREGLRWTKRMPLEDCGLMIGWEKMFSHQGSKESNKKEPQKVGLITTKYWTGWAGLEGLKRMDGEQLEASTVWWHLRSMQEGPISGGRLQSVEVWTSGGVHIADVFKIALGSDVKNIAQGLFSALRELDNRGVRIIYVEGVEDDDDIAAAVMNRLRKAATIIERPHNHCNT